MSYINETARLLADSFPVRFSSRQKEEFRTRLIDELAETGWEAEVITGGRLLRSSNVVTKNENADIILMAHYDTPTCHPPGIQSFARLFGQSGSSMFLIGFLGAAFGRRLGRVIGRTMTAIGISESLGYLLGFLLLALLFLPMFRANRHNSNDNTSGVLTLLSIAHALKDMPELRDRVQLAFVDLEEMGLHGSRHLSSYWRKQGVNLHKRQIIVFDCVGWGDVPLVCYTGKPGHLAHSLHKQLQVSEPKTVLTKLSLSDHNSFRRYGAVAVIYGNKALLGKGYYFPDVHTKRDINLNLNNISWLTEEIVEFCKATA